MGGWGEEEAQEPGQSREIQVKDGRSEREAAEIWNLNLRMDEWIDGETD